MILDILVYHEHATHEDTYMGVEQALKEYFYTPDNYPEDVKLVPYTLKIEVLSNEHT